MVVFSSPNVCSLSDDDMVSRTVREKRRRAVEETNEIYMGNNEEPNTRADAQTKSDVTHSIVRFKDILGKLGSGHMLFTSYLIRMRRVRGRIMALNWVHFHC